MDQTRIVLAFAAVAGMAAVTQGQFSVPPVAPPGPLAAALLPGIDDPGVVADLKLSQLQVDVLVGRRHALWDEAYSTAPNALSAGAKARMDETDALLKKTLSAEQYTRAQKLAAQHIINEARSFKGIPTATGYSVTFFKRYPEFMVAFKLTDEQKKTITDPAKKFGIGFSTLGVTPEQIAAAGDFYGPPLAKEWVAKSDPRMSRRPGPPRELTLLDAKDVRAEINLTDDQQKVLSALRSKWSELDAETKSGFKGAPATRRPDISPKEHDEKAAALRLETEKAIPGTLAANQFRRLRQLAFQNAYRGVHIEQLYKVADVIGAIAITEEQSKRLDATREAYVKEATKVFDSGESYAVTAQRLKDLAAARRDQAAAVLTPEQSSRLKSIVGEPFTGSFAAETSRFSPAVAQVRAANFGLYSTEFTQLATNKSIQQDLKLSAEQIARCYEVRDEVQSKFATRAGSAAAVSAKAAEKSKFIEAELGKILTAGQSARFRQIMMQALEIPSTGFGRTASVGSAVAYPGAAEAIKLTEEQKKSLIAGSAAKDVLTNEQTSALDKMLGERFEGDFTTNTKAPAKETAAPLSQVAVLLVGPNGESAEAELKLTPDQAKQIAAARADYQAAIRPDPDSKVRPGSLSTSKVRSVEGAKFEKTVLAILTPAQSKRLDQLIVQSAAGKDLFAAMTSPETAKRLGLTPEQTEKLAAIDDDADRLQRLRTSEGVEFDQKLGARLRDAADARMLAALTADQRTRWQEIVGEPWAGATRTIPTRFGPFSR